MFGLRCGGVQITTRGKTPLKLKLFAKIFASS